MKLIKIEPGTELFFREATLRVSSPLLSFTVEFGMESKWFHCAKSTRKIGEVLLTDPQDCINLDVGANNDSGQV
jgi:hypothetical protein